MAVPSRSGAREYDSATGRYYNRARFYDPDLGRFISEDPIGLAGGINPYAYADGDPANRIDPYGLYSCPAPGRPCPVILPGLQNSWDWLLWEQIFFFRAGPSVGLQGENPGADDIWNGLLAFYLIQMDYEQVREEAGELPEDEEKPDWGQCLRDAGGATIGVIGDATIFTGVGLAVRGALAIRAGHVGLRQVAAREVIKGRGALLRRSRRSVSGGTGMLLHGTNTAGLGAAGGMADQIPQNPDSETSVWKFVPFYGTYLSLQDAWVSCGSAIEASL